MGWFMINLPHCKFADSYQLAHKSFKSFPYQRTTNAQVMHSRFITQVSNEFDIIFVHFLQQFLRLTFELSADPKTLTIT